MKQRVILMHAAAPAKPPEGQPCNGCGVCCLAQPCPVGIILSLRRSGPCRALTWNSAESRYRCGALQVGRLQAWPPLAAGWQALARRWIAAGQGCDCSLQALKPDTAH